MELSKVDKTLLYELSLDPRANISELARKAKMSRDQVSDRIKKFELAGLILRINALVPFGRFGTFHFLFRIKLKASLISDQNKILKCLTANPNVTWVARLSGTFDMAYVMRCSDPYQAATFRDSLLKDFYNFISKLEFSVCVETELLSREYLVGKKSRKKSPGRKGIEYKALRELDFKILELLSVNGRISDAEIARKLIEDKYVSTITREAISYRIRNLERDGWIEGYFLVLNPGLRNIYYCKIRLKFSYVSLEKVDNLLKYCRSYPGITCILKLLGRWDCELDLECEDYRQAREFVMLLTNSVENVIEDYEISIVDSVEKWDYSKVLAQLREESFKGN